MAESNSSLAPQEVGDNLYIPSKAILAVMVRGKSNYKSREYPNPYRGDKKVLVICTEENHLEMENGHVFLTGNHPVEMFVPLLHMHKAGFPIEIATATGAPVQFENWAFPEHDEAVIALRGELLPQLDHPSKLSEIAENFGDQFAAIFIPGGHGALLGLPENRDVEKIFVKAMKLNMFIISLCHGPASFLSTSLDYKFDDFLFRNYEIVCNPDVMDRQLSRIGYLPGKLKWGFSELLEGFGVKIENSMVTGKTHVDRNVITGDGPPAADRLGRLAADALLKTISVKG